MWLAGAAALLLLTALGLNLFVFGVVPGPSAWRHWWGHLSAAGLTRFIRELGGWGVLAAVGLMVLHSFIPFPAELVAIANGMVFGLLWGTVITWVGAMAGAFAAFALARNLGRPFVGVMVSRHNWQPVDRRIARHGAAAVFLSRFVPVVAFNLVNYAAGLTRISWWTFAWTTGLGILPMTVLMVALGDSFDALPWELWLVVVAAAALLWFILRRVLRNWN